MLWLISQRYELKANHNNIGADDDDGNVVVNKSKIRIESKSQRQMDGKTNRLCCG